MFLILILITIQYAFGRQLPEDHIRISKQLKSLPSDDNILSYNQKHIGVGDEISKSINSLHYDEGTNELIDRDSAVIPIRKVKTNAKKPRIEKSRINWQINSNKVEKFMKPKKIKKFDKNKKVKKLSNQKKKELDEILNSIKNAFAKMYSDEEEIVMEPDDDESEQEIPFEETNAENNKAINDEALKSEEISTEDSKQITDEEINSQSTEDIYSENNKLMNIHEINTENLPTIEGFDAENNKEINTKIPNAFSTTESMVKIEEMTPEVTTDLEPYQIDAPTNTADEATQTETEFNKESTTKIDDDLSLQTELKTIAQILLKIKPLDHDEIVQTNYELLLIYKNMVESINSLTYALTTIDKTMSEHNALISKRKCDEIDQTLPLIPTKVRANWKDECFKALPVNREDFTRIKRESILNYNHVKNAYGDNKKKLIRQVEEGFLYILTKLQSINLLTSMYSKNGMFVIGYIASKAEHLEGELLNKKTKIMEDLATCSNKKLSEVLDFLQNSKYKLKNFEKLLTQTLLKSVLPQFEKTLITGH